VAKLRIIDTIHWGNGAFKKLNHFTKLDLCGGLEQQHATASAAGALHQASSYKRGDQMLQIRKRNLLPPGDFL